MTLLYMPVLPVKNRYPEEWYHQFPREFERLGVDYITIDGGMEVPVEFEKREHDMFTSLELGAEWELNQIQKLLELSDEMTSEDIIFFTDIDFPGFCLPFAQLIKLKVPGVKIFGYLHAGSYCRGDIFSETPGKLNAESATLAIMGGVFVATNYHVKLLTKHIGGGCPLHVVGAPFYRDQVGLDPILLYEREFDVIYSSRMDKQNPGTMFMKVVAENPEIQFVCTSDPPDVFDNLVYAPTHNRQEYYSVLQQSRVYLSMATESTFGYGVVEAMSLGLIPIVPNNFSFPEVVRYPRYLYGDFDNLNAILRNEVKEARWRKGYPLFPMDRWEESIEKMIDIMMGD